MKTIALLTDFGLADNFVGVIKDVLTGINPSARCIDISHQIRRHDINKFFSRLLPAGSAG